MSFVARIDADIGNFRRNLAIAQQAADDFSANMGVTIANIGQSFIKIGGAISLGVTTPLVAAGAAAYNMAADFEDSLGAVDQIFKQSSDQVSDWAKNLDSAFGISKKEALEYSNLMGSMLVNIGGLTEEQAAKQSAKLIELAGDLTAMYGGETKDAVRTLTGALKGNNAMLDNYGMAANDALVKAKALSLGLVEQGKEMTLAAKQTATLALIYEQSGAAQGQAAREADGASGSMRAFKTEVTNLTTELGEHLLPIITPIVNSLKNMVSSFRSMTPEAQKTTLVIAGVAAAIGPLLVGLGTLMQLAPLVGSAFAVITGPIGIAVAAVAAATYLIIKNWDDIKAYFTTGGGSKIWTSISGAATDLYNELKIAFTQISNFITDIWDKIGSNVKSIVGSSFKIVVDIISIAIDTIIGTVKFFSNILKGDFGSAFEAVRKMTQSIFGSIQNIVLNSLKILGNYLSGFFKLIGADSWGSAIENFSNKLAPSIDKVKVSTVEATKAVENNTVATVKNKETVTASAEELKKAADAAKKFAEEQKSLTSQLNAFILAARDQKNINTILETITNKYNGISEVMGKIKNIDPFQVALVSGLKLQERLTALTGAFKGFSGKDIQPTGVINLPEINTAALDEQMSKVKAKVTTDITDFNINISEMMGSMLVNAMGSLGETLATGGNVLEAVSKSVLSTMGGLMVSLGEMAIKAGAGILAVQIGLKTLNPFVALAAGAALVAIGSAFSSGAKNLGNTGSGGGYSQSASGSQYNSIGDRNTGKLFNNDKQVVELRLKNGELTGAINLANKRNDRLV